MNLQNKVFEQVKNIGGSTVREEIWKELILQLSLYATRPVSDQVMNQVWRQTRDQVWNQIENELTK
jgi:hypothetical protein